MAAKYAIHATKDAGKVALHISGVDAHTTNTDLLNECFSELLACAEANRCFERGLNSKCLGTIANHDTKAACVSKAFGFARAAG